MPVMLQGAAGPVELLTYREAADLLGVEPQTIRMYVKRRVLHPIRLARTAEHPRDTPFLLREELAWYDRRRHAWRARDIGPNPFTARYAQLLITGGIVPVLADRQGAPASVPAPAPAQDATAGLPGIPLAALGLAAALLLAAALPLILDWLAGRQPEPQSLAQLRDVPGASEMLRDAAGALVEGDASQAAALRGIADLLDTAA